jgi:hypothetical protein
MAKPDGVSPSGAEKTWQRNGGKGINRPQEHDRPKDEGRTRFPRSQLHSSAAPANTAFSASVAPLRCLISFGLLTPLDQSVK